MLTCLVPVLFTFYIQYVLKLKKNNSGGKGLMMYTTTVSLSNIYGTGSVLGDRGSTVVNVLCYKSEGRWFDPSWCQWIFH